MHPILKSSKRIESWLENIIQILIPTTNLQKKNFSKCKKLTTFCTIQVRANSTINLGVLSNPWEAIPVEARGGHLTEGAVV